MAQGDLAGALKSYRDYFTIIDRLAKADPGNAGWQRDLSVSYNKIGGVQVEQGDLAGALKSFQDDLAIAERLAKAQGDLAGAMKSFQDGLAIRDKLAKADPGHALWQRDLSVSYNKIGDVKATSPAR
jgi:tetratricopeptide (TPR) repeat protein